MPAQSYLDDGFEFAFSERFQKIAEGISNFCRLKNVVVTVSGQINYRNVAEQMDLFNSFQSVHPAPELYIHQDEIRLKISSLLNGFLTITADIYDCKPH